MPGDNPSLPIFSFLFLLRCLKTSSFLSSAAHQRVPVTIVGLAGRCSARRHGAWIFARPSLPPPGVVGGQPADPECIAWAAETLGLRLSNQKGLCIILASHSHRDFSALLYPGPSKVLELYCNQLLLPCCKDHRGRRGNFFFLLATLALP